MYYIKQGNTNSPKFTFNNRGLLADPGNVFQNSKHYRQSSLQFFTQFRFIFILLLIYFYITAKGNKSECSHNSKYYQTELIAIQKTRFLLSKMSLLDGVASLTGRLEHLCSVLWWSLCWDQT